MISNIILTFRAWFKRLIVLEEKMSKLKEKAMVEEKKERGKVEDEKEGRGGKKKMERLPKPGSPGNPFRCGQGLKCPWVDGERGPRCRQNCPKI